MTTVSGVFSGSADQMADVSLLDRYDVVPTILPMPGGTEVH